MIHKVRIGIIGTGNISSIYLESPSKFNNIEIAAVADIDLARAQAQAEKFGVQAMSVDALLADPTIEIVINLTVPMAHGEVALKVLNAGKSVYNEKPLAYDKAQAAQMLALAKQKGLLVGCAPDTFMGGGLQTCRALIDSGEIGKPVSATALMLSSGMESWHPNPEFFFQPGAGPMFDMGPYYLTALVSLMGPARRVAGMTAITHAERTVTSKPLYGTKIKVNTPTNVTGVVEFLNGAIATVITTWDVGEGYTPSLTVYGSKATLVCPDPNTFGGPIKLKKARQENFEEVEVTRPWTGNSRGLGVADMALALRSGHGAHYRANGNLANHVLEMMHAFLESSASGQYINLQTTCEQPQALPADWL